VSSLTWALHQRTALSAHQMGGIYRIRQSLHGAIDRGAFLAELADKDRVVLVLDEQQEVRGFSTLQVYEDRWGWVLMSGDTALERSATSGPVLQAGWLAAAMAAHEEHGPLDWVLLAGSPRAYRCLPEFFRRYWPDPSNPTPAPLQKRLDARGITRFGEQYDRGIVRRGARQQRGESDSLQPDDPVDRFFRSRNPGWERGDELVCLTEITPDNLTESGHRMLRRLTWSRAPQ
jgi:hypothetical protein